MLRRVLITMELRRKIIPGLQVANETLREMGPARQFSASQDTDRELDQYGRMIPAALTQLTPVFFATKRHIPIQEALDFGDVARVVTALSRHITTIVDSGYEHRAPIEDRRGDIMQSELLHPVLSQDMNSILLQLQREDAGMPDPTTLPPAEAREISERTNQRWNQDLPPMRQIDDVQFPSPEGHTIDARLFTPPDALSGLILFIHGGGFGLCSVDTHERAARVLATDAKCTVLSVAYRLAPEHPFPAGLNDCIATYRQLPDLHKAFAWTKGPTAVAGDSAGANLALAMILHEQANGSVVPDFAMLFYGAYDADFQTDSYLEYENGPGLTRGKMMRFFDWYAPKDTRHNPLICPLLASDSALTALPPLFLNAAQADPLFSDTKNLASRLSALGRNDQVQIYPGVVHGFMQMTSKLTAARDATADAAAAFRQQMEQP